MANLKDLKSRIVSIKNTQQITKAVKMIAANKLRQAQQSLSNLEYYNNQLLETLSDISPRYNDVSINVSENTLNKPKLLIIIGSNRGLAGAFNNNIIKESIKYIETLKNSSLEIITIGKKIFDYYTKNKITINKDYSYILDNLNFTDSYNKICEIINVDYYSEIIVIYNKFKNAAVQIIDTKKIYPLDLKNILKINHLDNKRDYILEPSKKDLIKNLIYSILVSSIYNTLIHSYTSEQGARMVTMDQASENASNLLNDLTLEYNQIRQSIITNEILEISAAAKALNK